jgi:ABC-type amino acid transport substrate-binding protein
MTDLPISQNSSDVPNSAVPSVTPPISQPVVAHPSSAPPKTNTYIRIILAVVLAGVVLIVILFVLLKNYNTQLTVAPVKKPTVERLQTKGKIIIGTDATYEPMEFIDATGHFNGFDIELINRITEKIGIQPEFKNVVFDDIFDALEKKQIDLIISSVSITDERKKKFDFSDSYLNAGQVIITRKENDTIKTTADLAGKRIAVQSGTTSETQALSFTSPNLVSRFDDNSSASAALADKKVDAIFADLTGAKGIVVANPGLKIASEPFTNEQYGIVFRKGEGDLVEEVNASLNSLRQQGVLVFLKQKWLE